MGFTPYSQIVQPAEYIDPVSKDLLLQGTKYQQENIKSGVKDFYESIDTLNNIPSLPGIDTEKKKEIIEQVMGNLSDIVYSDFKNPNTSLQIKSYINKIVNNPDIQGIYERASKFNEDYSVYKDLVKKGKTVSPWLMGSLNQAEKYINDGVYKRDDRFTGNVQADPEIQDFKKEIISLLKPEKQTYFDNASGKVITKEGVSKDRISQALYQGVQTNGVLKEYYDKMFDYYNEGISWEQESDKYYMNQIEKQNQIILSPVSTLEEKQEAKQNISAFEKAMMSPNKSYFLKEKLKNQWLMEQFQADADAYETISESEKYDEKYLYSVKKAIDFEYKKKEYDLKKTLEKEKIQKLDSVSKKLYTEAIDKGIDVFDEFGELISPKELSYKISITEDDTNEKRNVKLDEDFKEVSKEKILTGDLRDLTYAILNSLNKTKKSKESFTEESITDPFIEGDFVYYNVKNKKNKQKVNLNTLLLDAGFEPIENFDINDIKEAALDNE